MSKEAFVQFREAVKQSSSLQAELVNTVKSKADLVAMGKRLGFEFADADLESPALTDEELGRVVGGTELGWTRVMSWFRIGPPGTR